jgi:hypothetical protein
MSPQKPSLQPHMANEKIDWTVFRSPRHGHANKNWNFCS